MKNILEKKIHTMNKLKKLNIGSTDVFLEDYQKGQGKITISDTYNGSFCYFWSHMGSNISDFLCEINSSYLINKLAKESEMYEFDGKATARNIRRYIRDELNYELPFYKYMSAQKQMRLKIKELEDCEDERHFVDSCETFVNDLDLFDLSLKEEKEFKEIIEPMFNQEPWNFIIKKESRTYRWLENLHLDIKKELKQRIAC